jgi:hypothetical protein
VEARTTRRTLRARLPDRRPFTWAHTCFCEEFLRFAQRWRYRLAITSLYGARSHGREPIPGRQDDDGRHSQECLSAQFHL